MIMKLKLMGFDNVKIKMHDGTMKTIGDVRHLSKLERNVVSFGRLDSHGYRCSTEGGVVKVSRGALIVMKGKLLHNNLYKLIGSAIQGGACNEVLNEVYKI